MNRVQVAGGIVGVTGALVLGGIALLPDERRDVNLAKGATEQVQEGEESLFAEIDPDTGEVLQVIVIDAELLNTGRWGDPKNFVRTYAEPERGRKNPAGIGYRYDKELDAFIPPKPFDSWELDEETAQWQAPVKMPEDEKGYNWDEYSKEWIEVKPEINEKFD